MLVLGIIFSLFGLGVLVCLLFTLAIYALPFSVAVTTGSINVDLRRLSTIPSKSITPVSPHIPNDGWTETGNAGSTLVPHTRINQAERTGIQQFRCQALRRHIGVRCKTGLVAGTAAYIMKRAVKIR